MIIDNENKSEALDLLADSIKDKHWKVNLEVIKKDKITITLTKNVRKCFLCEELHPITNLLVRQDKRVTNLFLPKLLCKPCVVKVDRLLTKLKPSQPKHLKLLSTQIEV